MRREKRESNGDDDVGSDDDDDDEDDDPNPLSPKGWPYGIAWHPLAPRCALPLLSCSDSLPSCRAPAGATTCCFASSSPSPSPGSRRISAVW